MACDLLSCTGGCLPPGFVPRGFRDARTRPAPRGDSNETGTAKAGHDSDRHMPRLLQRPAAASLSIPRLLLSHRDARGDTRTGRARDVQMRTGAARERAEA